MFCKNCGQETPNGSKFCTSCGAVVETAAASLRSDGFMNANHSTPGSGYAVNTPSASCAMPVEKLNVEATIREGIAIGIKNIGPIIVNVLLWCVTLLIPYLNVGTTIGLLAIVSKAAKGKAIPFTEIFDPKYRKYIGEFLITSALISMGACVGMLFFVIPGIVISLAWSLALLLVVDKGKNPTEAITLSNNCTYGYKWKMIGIYLIVGLIFSVGLIILSVIGGIIKVLMPLIALLMMGLAVLGIFAIIGVQASIYKQLTDEV